jgi:4'-phosphopantetheinyl transferase
VARVWPGVSVSWHAATTDAALALRIQVALVVGVEPPAVSVGRLCGRCGSSEHGRPWASHGVHVSLSRSGPHLLTAVSTTGPVGVDVEDVVAAERAWCDVSEHDDVDAAQAWCRFEAVLKRDGTGLAARSVDAVAVDATVLDLDAPDGYRAAVAFAAG